MTVQELTTQKDILEKDIKNLLNGFLWKLDNENIKISDFRISTHEIRNEGNYILNVLPAIEIKL